MEVPVLEVCQVGLERKFIRNFNDHLSFFGTVGGRSQHSSSHTKQVC